MAPRPCRVVGEGVSVIFAIPQGQSTSLGFSHTPVPKSDAPSMPGDTSSHVAVDLSSSFAPRTAVSVGRVALEYRAADPAALRMVF